MAKTHMFDPITMEVIRNSMESIIDEMALSVTRTAHSPLARELFDFATGFCDARGNILAEGLTNPTHALVATTCIEAIRRIYPPDSIYPGDIFMTNDPYEGASHIPDVYLLRPIFIDGEIVAFSTAISHQMDMGGRVAGSNACDSTEIFQEGLRIPPLKFFERDEINPTLVSIFQKNVRVPDVVLGDIRALEAACRIGERRFLELARTYGWETLRSYLYKLMDYSERRVRADISALPDGEYEFTDHLDDDGFDPDPIPIHVKVIVKGDTITFDFTGTSPQVKGAMNCTLTSTKTLVNAALRLLVDPSIPSNAGVFRPIRVIAPEGTIVNPVFPAPVAGRGSTMGRIEDTIYGALAQLAPDKVPACFANVDPGVSIGGYDADRKPFVFVEFLMGGWGGRPWADGVDANTSLYVNYSNEPIEVIEREAHVRIEQYSFVPDSGGAGKYRGSLGMTRDLRFTGEEAVLQLRTERTRFAPFGLYGGKPGAFADCFLNPDNERRQLRKCILPIKKDDIVRIVVAGAGGWGNPKERDPERVLEDVRNEKISMKHARQEYGVVLDEKTMQVDMEATRRLRQGG